MLFGRGLTGSRGGGGGSAEGKGGVEPVGGGELGSRSVGGGRVVVKTGGDGSGGSSRRRGLAHTRSSSGTSGGRRMVQGHEAGGRDCIGRRVEQLRSDAENAK